MGLLDIWNDWRKESGYGRDDLTTAGGSNEQSLQRKYKRGQFPPTDPKYIRENKEVRDRLGRIIEPGSPVQNAEFNTRFSNKVPVSANGAVRPVENKSKAELARNLALKNPDVASVSKSGQVTYKQDARKTPN